MKIIVRNYNESRNIDVSDYSRIEFGEGQDKIVISARNNIINVRSIEGAIQVLPRAANSIEVKRLTDN